MAPMIDMVFLLLVFFMCVSTLAQAEKQAPVELPESQRSKVPDDLSGRGIISVDVDGTIYIGSREVELEDILKSMEQRDLVDTSRENSPLRPADDARVVDTDSLSFDQVVDLLCGFAKEVL